jgi:hypothetical protein
MATASTTTTPPAVTTSHPLYADWAPTWRALTHCFEGSGGFRDGTYIIAHPREWEDHSIPVYEGTGDDRKLVRVETNPNPSKPTAKLKERRALARYENFAARIVETKASALFRQDPSRMVAGDAEAKHPWLDWCQNVDGAGTKLTAYLQDAWKASAVQGHTALYMDRPASPIAPKTMAEVQAPYLRCYTALDMVDWLTNDAGELTAAKFQEAVPRTNIKENVIPASQTWRVRIVTADGYEVIEESARGNGKRVSKPVNEGPHSFGRLPVALLYAKRRTLISTIGASLLGDPKLHIDLFNLISEKRELLRKQTFSMLNIPLGTGDAAVSIEEAQRMIGQSTGTSNVLFSALAASFVTADSSNVTVYQEECGNLVRVMFRLSGLTWESDSKDAEAQGSLKIKREDLNQLLSSYADETERTEMAIAELFFRAHYGPDSWEAEWEKAEPQVRYSRNFDATPFDELLSQANAAMALPLGQSPAFLLELCRRLLPMFLPDLPPNLLEEIEKEIEALPTPQEQRQQRLKEMAATFEKKAPGAGGAFIAAEHEKALRDEAA